MSTQEEEAAIDLDTLTERELDIYDAEYRDMLCLGPDAADRYARHAVAVDMDARASLARCYHRNYHPDTLAARELAEALLPHVLERFGLASPKLLRSRDHCYTFARHWYWTALASVYDYKTVARTVGFPRKTVNGAVVTFRKVHPEAWLEASTYGRELSQSLKQEQAA